MSFCFAASRRRTLAAAVLAAALLGCGGGEPIERFVARRLIVLGDEFSVLEAGGIKYSVNALTNGVPDCAANPLWVQIVANAYGLMFANCPNPTGNVTALNFAAAGAKVSDIPAQIDAVGGFVEKDLVTLLAGANDIYEQYALVAANAQTAQAAIGAATNLGVSLAGQVNRIADSGGKVLISTLPDLGATPFALAPDAPPGRAALLTQMTQAFNSKVLSNITNDGRRIGLLLTEDLFRSIVRTGGAGTGLNVKDAACDVTKAPVVTQCTTDKLVTGATAGAYLWADDRWFSFGGHAQLANLALVRALSNPF